MCVYKVLLFKLGVLIIELKLANKRERGGRCGCLTPIALLIELKLANMREKREREVGVWVFNTHSAYN